MNSKKCKGIRQMVNFYLEENKDRFTTQISNFKNLYRTEERVKNKDKITELELDKLANKILNKMIYKKIKKGVKNGQY